MSIRHNSSIFFFFKSLTWWLGKRGVYSWICSSTWLVLHLMHCVNLWLKRDRHWWAFKILFFLGSMVTFFWKWKVKDKKGPNRPTWLALNQTPAIWPSNMATSYNCYHLEGPVSSEWTCCNQNYSMIELFEHQYALKIFSANFSHSKLKNLTSQIWSPPTR